MSRVRLKTIDGIIVAGVREVIDREVYEPAPDSMKKAKLL
jgi:gamma-glutamyl-gamma-aminobutyrate hydrolase PuuD